MALAGGEVQSFVCKGCSHWELPASDKREEEPSVVAQVFQELPTQMLLITLFFHPGKLSTDKTIFI